jgi:microcystin-dependent protein
MFNVLLSQDGGTLTSPNSTGQVSSLIYAFEQPNRYLGLSIRQVPGGTLSASAPEISPRQQFASAPYAMHAQQASLATSAILANNALSFATYNTNDFLMATKPTQTLKGSLTISNGTLTVNGNVTATALVGYGTIPIGGIVMWSGAATAIPDGWALCDGATSNGRVTPDLRNRFVVGAGSHYAVGDTGGADSVTLTLNQIPSHTHNYTQGERQTFFGHGAYDNMWVDTGATVATTSAGGGQAHENRPPYYALCYIMRVQ